MTGSLLLMKIVLTLVAKSILMLLGLLATMSATDAATEMKIYGSSATLLIISDKEMEDLMKIVK